MTRFKSKTPVIPQFVAGEHGLFGGHKSEDIRTFSLKQFILKIYFHNIVSLSLTT